MAYYFNTPPNVDGSPTIHALTVISELSNRRAIACIDVIVAGLPHITEAGTNTTIKGLDLTSVIELHTF